MVRRERPRPEHAARHARHLTGFIITTVIVCTALGVLFFMHDFIPRSSSVERQSIDSLLKILFGIGGIIFGLIVSLFVYSISFFRVRRGELGDGPAIRGNGALELAWTAAPVAIVAALSVYGGIVLMDMTKLPPPQEALNVNVTAQRFNWQFDYPDASVTSFELHLIVNRPVVFSMQSKDVIHSFWVQEFGPKQDIVPGMTTTLRLTPTKIGQYIVQCSQLCGYGHSYMLAPVYVTSEADFQTWLSQQQQQKQAGQKP